MDIKLIIYYLCMFLGLVASSLIGYYLAKRAGFTRKTIATYLAIGITTGLLSAVFMGQLQNFIMSLTGLPYYTARIRIFGALLFNPVLFYFPVKLIGGDYHKVLDIFSAGTYATLGIAKIGCAVYGCCYGVACEWGVTTPFESHRVFPVQLLECVLSLVICAVIFFIAVKNKHRKGTIYPLSLVLYGVMRFFVEYLRYYPEAERTFFFGMNFWQMFSAISVVIGALWLIYMYHGKSRGLQKADGLCE